MYLVLIKLLFKVLEDEGVLNAINAAAHNASTDGSTMIDTEITEFKIQHDKTKRILTVMSANVKNWVYK